MLTFTRGDTFRMAVDIVDTVTGAPFDATGAMVTAKLREAVTRALIEDLVASVQGGAIELFASAAQTALWPLADALIDVRMLLPSGDTVTTRTAQLRIERAVSE